MTESPLKKVKVSGTAQAEMDKLGKQFDAFDENVKSLTLDRMNEAPKQESEPTHKLSQTQIANSKDVYLKPDKIIGCRDRFNEKFRDDYNFQKEYVNFIAENKELIGETIEIWTRPFGGVPAEYWKVPTNKPVWGPRYLAEQIKRKFYHRLVMTNTVTEATGMGQMYGQLAADTTIQRLDANPVSSRKSVFLGAQGF